MTWIYWCCDYCKILTLNYHKIVHLTAAVVHMSLWLSIIVTNLGATGTQCRLMILISVSKTIYHSNALLEPSVRLFIPQAINAGDLHVTRMVSDCSLNCILIQCHAPWYTYRCARPSSILPFSWRLSDDALSSHVTYIWHHLLSSSAISDQFEQTVLFDCCSNERKTSDILSIICIDTRLLYSPHVNGSSCMLFPVANNESSEVIDVLLPVTFYLNPSPRLDNVKNFWRFVINLPVESLHRSIGLDVKDEQAFQPINKHHITQIWDL